MTEELQVAVVAGADIVVVPEPQIDVLVDTQQVPIIIESPELDVVTLGEDVTVVDERRETTIITVGEVGPVGATGASNSGEPLVVLADGSTITVDISLGTVFGVTLGGNRLIEFTGGTAPLNGRKVVIELKQDAIGGRTVTWGTSALFGVDLPATLLSSTPGVTDFVGAIYRSVDDKCVIIAFARGY